MLKIPMTLMVRFCYFSPKQVISTQKLFTTAILNGNKIGKLMAVKKV